MALPKMQADLGFSQSGLSWVFNAYVVAFGGLLLLGGRLSDLFGARRVFTTGWAVLLGGSVVAALAGTASAQCARRQLKEKDMNQYMWSALEDAPVRELFSGNSSSSAVERWQR